MIAVTRRGQAAAKITMKQELFQSIDTSMGFTPLEGLIMGTRCGDLDPGVIAFLEREEKLSASKSEVSTQ